MKKNLSIYINVLVVLVLSMLINTNYVNAAIAANGEQWENECKYEGRNGQFSLYIKSGKSMVILKTQPSGDTLIIYSGYDKEKQKTSDGDRIYYLTNKIVINDGKCPTIIYEKNSNRIDNLNRVLNWYTYTASDNGGKACFLKGGNSSSMSSIDNKSDEECGQIIDQTVRKLINKYLGYIHIIVPMLIIALGTYDFFRAMIASKEDEMKKAQKRFIIRLVAGVLVFLAPTIVNLVIDILNKGVCPV